MSDLTRMEVDAKRLRAMLRVLIFSLLLTVPARAEESHVPDGGGFDSASSSELPLLGDGGSRALVPEDLAALEFEEADGVAPELEGVDEVADSGVCYSCDLSEDELLRRWMEEPQSLGSISVGLAEAGRVVNAVPMPPGPAWVVMDPPNAWATQETIDYLAAAATAVRELFPAAPPLRINHLSKQNGGYLRPHQSHQAGRDADLGFFYSQGEDPRRLKRRRELAMDLSLNWALLEALVTKTDAQFILVDKRIQAQLYAFALQQGKDKDWLDKIFKGPNPIIRHARRHRDHFHVRFFSARSQELGRRIQPLLAKQPDQNLVIHRVRKGETLAGLAFRYHSQVKSIQRANGMKSTALRQGCTLNIPIRGPCTHCPLPPPVVVPPRCLPPQLPPKS